MKDPKDLLIREARPEDGPAISSLLNSIIDAGAYTVLDGPISADFERAFIENFPARGIFNVAEVRPDQRIVGVQTLDPFAPYTSAFDHVGIIATYIDLSLRGRGIGRRLSEATLATAKEKGYEKIFTYVRADNSGALVFYQGLGFRVVGTAQKQAKVGGRYIDEVIIEKFL